MDIPRLYALRRYWAQHPPLREMVQAYLGIKIESKSVIPQSTPSSSNKPSTTCSQNTEADMKAFIEMFQAAGGRRG
ncbi:MAG: hypothetical protein HO274_02735 [Ferrovum myxofaciens]|uniref:hypothetical protein n=1 Tax=Ferrovum myxofaciens TaxID=416213 RepID=UPI002354CD27|nr:hypothetical protein [Ferrovum myxofaciens]QKE40367.1 MAG: hypothetical protein HO274_02735 [Ferrovum myxofaciens]